MCGKIEVKHYKLGKGTNLSDEKKIEIAKEIFRVEVESGRPEKDVCEAVGVNYDSFRCWRSEGHTTFNHEVLTLYKKKKEDKSIAYEKKTLELAEAAMHRLLTVHELRKGKELVEIDPHPSIVMFAKKNLKPKIYGENKEKEETTINGSLLVPAEMVNPVFSEIMTRMTRFYDNYKTVRLVSGARSGKTTVIIDIFLDWLMTGKLFGRTLENNAAIMMKPTFESMKHTLLKSFKDRIIDRKLEGLIEWHQGDKKFSYDGRYITYMGIDKPVQNVLGSEWGISWANECNFAPQEQMQQILGRTEGKIFVDANPEEEVGWIIDLEEDKDTFNRHIKLEENYFLNPEIEKALRKQGEKDSWFQKVYVEGVRAPRRGAIYENWEVVEKEPGNYEYKIIGVDLGHTAPTAVILCKICEGGANDKDDLYWKQLAYTPALSYSKIAKLIVEHNCNAIADSAEPESIRQINIELKALKSDLICRPAKKTRVADECTKIATNFNIGVDKSSPNILQEIQMYRMAIIKSKAGNIQTDIPIKKDDHAMDAGRYAAMYYLRIKLNERASKL